MTAEDWEAEWGKYRSSPEFRRVNSRMSLEEFKFIYWMEYAHRMWGRSLGLVFAVPALYFAARGHIRGPLAGRLGLLFLMGGAQVRPPRRAPACGLQMHYPLMLSAIVARPSNGIRVTCANELNKEPCSAALVAGTPTKESDTQIPEVLPFVSMHACRVLLLLLFVKNPRSHSTNDRSGCNSGGGCRALWGGGW